MTTPYSSYGTPANNNSQGAYPSTQSTPTHAPTTTHFTSVLSSANFNDQSPSVPGTPTPSGTAGRGKPRGSATGAKRGRKPRGALVAGGSASPRPFLTSTFNSTITGGATSTPTSFAAASSPSAQYPKVHWAMPNASAGASGSEGTASLTSPVAAGPSGGGEGIGSSAAVGISADASAGQSQEASTMESPAMVIDPALMGAGGTIGNIIPSSQRGTPVPDSSGGLVLPGMGLPQPPPPGQRVGGVLGVDEEAEGDDELLPAMADDDYSAQLSWQSQSKDNLKVLMDNLSPAQYDRFEAYRRHALPKQAVRKVIQQSLGQQVSQPVAQIIAGFSKVFVGEIVEKGHLIF